MNNVVRGLKHRILLIQKCYQSVNAYNVLYERGFIANSTSYLQEHLASGSRAIYAGFDPTAESLHVGNLVTLMTLLQLRRAGHLAYFVIGGATGLIGDPSGRLHERIPLSNENIQHNVDQIKNQIVNLLQNDLSMWSKETIMNNDLLKPSSNGKVNRADNPDYFNDRSDPSERVINNANWYENFQVVQFLSSVGRHFRLGSMLAKESVKQRLSSPEGMCLTEFFYQVFQAYDFQRMSAMYDCFVQIGGNDQWGNITAGCEFIHKVDGKQAHGLTIPLLTNTEGEKLGKSMGNSIWLSPTKTSSYEFYQYFMRTEDADVERFLKLFTFIPLEDIRTIVVKHMEKPEERYATTILADEVTRLVHGEDGLQDACNATAIFYGNLDNLTSLSIEDIQELLIDAPTVLLTWDGSLNMAELAFKCGAVPSFNQGRKLINSGGFYVNNEKVIDYKAIVQEDIRKLSGKVTLIRTGKKHYRLILWAD